MENKPELKVALLDEEDITDKIRDLYGENRDWNNKVIRYSDFLTEKDVGRILQVKWRRSNGRIESVIIRIRDINSIFYGDLSLKRILHLFP